MSETPSDLTADTEAASRRSRTDHVDFDEGVAVETSAGRMDLLTCTSCGAAVLADPGTWRHKAWHEAVDRVFLGTDR